MKCSFPLALFALLPVQITIGFAGSERGMVSTVHPLATKAGVEAMRRGGERSGCDCCRGSHAERSGWPQFRTWWRLLPCHPPGEWRSGDDRWTRRQHPLQRHAICLSGTVRRSPNSVRPVHSRRACQVRSPAFEQAVRKFGKRPWREHCLAAAELAKEGFRVTRDYAKHVAGVAKDIERFPSSRAVFLRADGLPLAGGRNVAATGSGEHVSSHWRNTEATGSIAGRLRTRLRSGCKITMGCSPRLTSLVTSPEHASHCAPRIGDSRS
jgi:hypothetical protein